MGAHLKIFTALLVVGGCVMVSGCETAKVIQKLSDDRTAASAGLPQQQSGRVNANGPASGRGLQMTDTQIAELTKHLDAKNQESPAILRAREQSRDLVRHVTMRTACTTNNRADNLKIDMRLADGNVFLYGARSASATSPVDRCYGVARLTGWRMPTLNTLQYCADYYSEISGEGTRLCNELITKDGETWLIRGGLTSSY
jgi:hypothetical protein